MNTTKTKKVRAERRQRAETIVKNSDWTKNWKKAPPEKQLARLDQIHGTGRGASRQRAKIAVRMRKGK